MQFHKAISEIGAAAPLLQRTVKERTLYCLLTVQSCCARAQEVEGKC